MAGRLRGAGVDLDSGDLEACYAAAWQGLYKAVLDGQEIANPAGWLVLVTFRRAIEEHRARLRAHRGGDRLAARARRETTAGEHELAVAHERDLAAELDDRMRLRHLFEGLRGRLSVREREAAVLCYLQGLPRAQAAARMGVSEERMRKLMDGRGPGRPGVAGKVGALVETIRDGAWCEQQGSLMRGLAFGMLDPGGERHRLALMHLDDCPACRAYVASLRGLAAALPPILLPGGLGAAALVGSAAATGAGGGASAGVGMQLGRGVGGALSASSTAGAGGAAGGGWVLAGGGKLALGCLLALSVGTGCVAINIGVSPSRAPAPRHRSAAARRRQVSPRVQPAVTYYAYAYAPAPTGASPIATSGGSHAASATRVAPATRATREFGPERALAAGASSTNAPAAASGTPVEGARVAVAHTANSSSQPLASSTSSTVSRVSSLPRASARATREFSPG